MMGTCLMIGTLCCIMKLSENLDTNLFKKYSNILGLITNLRDPKISNIHSVSVAKTSEKLPNITFDYDEDIEVMINISKDNIQIIAPDSIYSKFKSLIISNYPDYEDIIIR